MTIAVVRGHASVDTIEKTWGVDRIDIPRAPGLGLLLEEVYFFTKDLDGFSSLFIVDRVLINFGK